MASLTDKTTLDAAISRHAIGHLMSLLVARGVITSQDRDHLCMQTISTLLNFEGSGVVSTIDPFYHPLRQCGLG